MTREEAIQEFQNVKDLIRQDGKDWFDERDLELIDMAIEALQGGDAEVNETKSPYMQHSRHDDGRLTREKAVKWVKFVHDVLYEDKDEEIREALNMAIEALSQPIVAKHFDIQSGYIYCSPQIAENVKVVVRCKDCRYRNGKVNRKGFEVCDATDMDITDNDFCSWGERREQLPQYAEWKDAFDNLKVVKK